MPEDGYSTDSSLTREMRELGSAIEDVELSDKVPLWWRLQQYTADIYVNKTSASPPTPQ